MFDFDLIHEAAERLKKRVRRTELIQSHHFGEKLGIPLWFKCENLQRTGAFKIRGALNFMTAQPRSALISGVITASAGNHAQGVAFAADLLGVRATVYMPENTPLQKVMATRDYGAEVVLTGRTFDEACSAALQQQRESGALFVHPFDDPLVMAGQGTIGLEIMEELPEVERVVVPIGGGGLIAGIVTAIKSVRPSVQVVGVQAVAAPSARASLDEGRIVQAPVSLTLADGIAVRKPGELTFPIISELVDEVVLVEEEEIALAIVALLEKTKVLVEGAGAVGLAALLNERLASPPGRTVCVLSGGNIDVKTIATVVERGLLAAGRFLRLTVELEDAPGSLARLTADVAAVNANIHLISHDRRSHGLALGRTEVRLELETRGYEHIERVVEHLRGRGYDVEVSP
jgi:threonine dehydratase